MIKILSFKDFIPTIALKIFLQLDYWIYKYTAMRISTMLHNNRNHRPRQVQIPLFWGHMRLSSWTWVTLGGYIYLIWLQSLSFCACSLWIIRIRDRVQLIRNSSLSSIKPGLKIPMQIPQCSCTFHINVFRMHTTFHSRVSRLNLSLGRQIQNRCLATTLP